MFSANSAYPAALAVQTGFSNWNGKKDHIESIRNVGQIASAASLAAWAEAAEGSEFNCDMTCRLPVAKPCEVPLGSFTK